MKSGAVVITTFILSLLVFSGTAHAGFGITPPYVRNDSLARDSIYEQRIVLTRSDPVEDLEAEVTVNVPGADKWISVDKGMTFRLPKDAAQVPIQVQVRVPGEAKYGEYKGNIRIVIKPASGPTPGTVGISLGAQIDVALNVVDRKIFDFKIRGVKIEDLEEGHKFLGFFFPGKIRFTMQVENLGNVPFGPTKVEFDIRDAAGTRLLETTQNLPKVPQVKPFEIKNVTAELPTRLPAGSYKATFRIYKNAEVVHSGEVNLSILPYGTLEGYKGFGFSGLRRSEQIFIVVSTLLVIAAIGLLVWLFRKWRHRRAGHG